MGVIPTFDPIPTPKRKYGRFANDESYMSGGTAPVESHKRKSAVGSESEEVKGAALEKEIAKRGLLRQVQHAAVAMSADKSSS